MAHPQKSSDVPLAIVGMGCLFPQADGLQAFWSNIKEKIDAIGPVPATHWRPEDYFDPDPKRPDLTYARRGGFLSPYPFNPAEFGISPRDLEAIDTAQLLGLVVARMALDDAGILSRGVDRRRVSVILGVTGTLEMVIPLGARLGHPLWRKALREAGVDDAVARRAVDAIAAGYVGWQENSFPGLLGNVVAGRIANRLDLGGTNCVVDAACASSLSALHLAGLELAAGRADAVLTGGVDTFNDIFMYMCFSKTPALSPTGDARPFDAAADGTILGEGLGMLVVRRLDDARRAGDRIYAVVRGLGTSSDGAGNAVYAPSAAGQAQALRDAYRRAGISPATVELIEAHGTGTKVGDAAELAALNEVFQEHRAGPAWCAIGSVKSQIGHTKAAAGAAGLIKAALALHHQVLPPTIKVREPAEAFTAGSPFYVAADPRPWLRRDDHPRRAAVSSFGFGGSNFHCVLEEAPAEPLAPHWDGDVQVFAWSAADRAGLRHAVDALTTDASDWAALRRSAADSRARFDHRHQCRLTAVVSRTGNPGETLARARQSADAAATDRDDVFFGEGEPGRLGVLFPGQGSQAVGMLSELACRFPTYREVLEQADRAFAAGLVEPTDLRLSDLIYPQPAFTAEGRAAQDSALRDTAVAQPALGAVCLAALAVLRQFGVRPDAAAGHSYGELTALCAAGCYDAPSLFALSQLRGRLMAGRRTGDAGAMLAVMAPLHEVEAAVAAEHVGVVIANRNAPAQAVLSGPTAEIVRAERFLTRRRLRHVRLPVAAAFHSPLVADATGPFRAALEPINFADAQLPVFSNSTSAEYPRDPQAARDLLAAQLARPVDFVAQIRNMNQSGVRTFVEVGPGSTLTRLVGAILHGEPHQALALDGAVGRRPGGIELPVLLARLAALGHGVRLGDWDPSPPPPPARKPGLIVPICGANYRANRESPAATPTNSAKSVAPVKPVMAEPSQNGVNQPRRGGAPAAPIAANSPLAAFQKLQEQTAELHRLFLEQQLEAQRTLQLLVSGGGAAVPPPAISPTPTALPPITDQPAPAAATRVHRPDPSPPAVKPSAPRPAPALVPKANAANVLLEVVAEKTGYPADMLGLDMSLDADLGIDSIKRVEILSALQERLPDAPAVPPDRLGSLRTLGDVAALLTGSPEVAAPAIAQPVNAEDDVAVLIEVVAEKTGYPADMLGLDMSLDADLGIDSIKRVEILSALQERLPHAAAVPPDRLGSLRTLRDVAEIIAEPPPGQKKKRPQSMTAG
jgi:polyketide-type polyunsaturated fatty acid synthase PfaA